MNPAERATILVVDDITENIAVLSATLRDQYRVIFATNGLDALEIVHLQRVDLILLDVMMPGMDGYEVCRQLKEDIATREIPVLFVTALGDAANEARGLALGASDHLHKPCHPDVVRLRVSMHLERRSQYQALESLVRERTRELNDTRTEIVRRLGLAAEYRDNETGMHVIRVSKTSCLLALAAGVPEAQAELLLDAAPMHDIGKIGIPDRVLSKPGPLDAEEWVLMKNHPSSALKSSAATLPNCSGWRAAWRSPTTKNGTATAIRKAWLDTTSLEGRIVAIADVYDALTSERPYKRAWSSEESMDYLRQQGGISFDPELVRLFVEQVQEVERIRLEYSDVFEPNIGDRR
jgi:putative two-component system response regulator